jgi:hypothetical protein
VRVLAVISALFLTAICLPVTHAETFVTKDGKVYVGKVVIESQNTVVVRTEEGTVSLDKNDLLDLPRAELEARGLLWRGRQAKAKADSACLLDDLGTASYYYDVSLAILASVDGSAKEQFDVAKQLIDEIKARVKELSATLDQQGLGVHQGLLFKRFVLEHHLREGHVLVGKAVWVAPSQLCDRCKTRGSIPCATCATRGQVTVRCPECRNGWKTCPYCRGTGRVTCSRCRGTGGHWRAACSSCGGAGKTIDTCRNCAGTGTVSVRCRTCRGKGVVVRKSKAYDNRGNVIWVETEVTCSVCGGNGSLSAACPVCGGKGSRTSTCWRCSGSGTVSGHCTDCGGSGYIPCSRSTRCEKCQGGGKIQEPCQACNGRGYTSCPTCGGKGYTGDPCPDPLPPETENMDDDADSDDATSTTEDGSSRHYVLPCTLSLRILRRSQARSPMT